MTPPRRPDDARRRAFLIGAAAAIAVPPGARAADRAFGGPALARAVAALERDAQGRLGVAILDTASGARFAWRGDERFPLCSTFKLVLAAAILRRVEQGRETLDRRVAVARADILDNSPLTEPRVGGSASVAELCEAAITRSDNAAANLLLATIGGPAGVTRFARALGDPRTRLDRTEPTLNEATPGDPRDTTTPHAMLGLLDRLARGRALAPASRARLVAWLAASRTGDQRLRAGLPAGWRVGDKTGAGGHGSNNEVAILWPPARAPLLVASYLTATPLALAPGSAVHARLGALIAGVI